MTDPRGHSTPEDRARRRKLVLIVALALVVIVGWIVAILALSGGEEQGGSSGSSGSEQAPERTGQMSPEAPVSEEGETSGTQKPASSGEGSGPSSSSSSSSGGPSEAELEDAADESLSPPPGGGAPESEVPIEDTEGRSNGQRGFVASFIGAAYGYTGEDIEEYRAGYEGRIDTGSYYDSGGGTVLEEYAAMVEDGGAENAAVLEGYRMTSGEPVETEVNEAELRQFAPREVLDGPMPRGSTDASISEVTYAVGDRYGDPSKDEDFGKVYGDVDYLKQRLFLSREEGGWKIVAASAPQSTEPPERPDPDAPKVMEPAGPDSAKGHEH